MSGDWKKRPEAGGWLAVWMIRAIGRYGGRGFARLFLYPITAYFLIRRHPERLASRQWLNRALGRPATLWDIAKHMHTFSATILDRIFLLGENTRRFDVEVSGLDALHAQLDQGRGMLLFGSHLGSFEVLRVLARQRPEYIIRVVLDKAHNPALTQLLDTLNPEVAATVIDAGQDGPALMLAIQEAVHRGALVALLVDRAHAGGQTTSAPFFGDEVRFPTAPWSIALALKVPVVLAFGLHRGGRRYDLRFEHFCDPIDVPRAQRGAAIADSIRRYAARLEATARGAPYNWFNFYNVWDASAASAAEGYDDARTTFSRSEEAGRHDAHPDVARSDADRSGATRGEQRIGAGGG